MAENINNTNITEIRVAETFAGVGGFTVGFEHANEDTGINAFRTVWADQWEPNGRESKQFAWRCYESHYGKGSCINRDINKVLDDVSDGKETLPQYDLLCGGFPCFTGETLVMTDRGPKPIMAIHEGDMVLTHKNRYRKVLHTMSHYAPKTMMIEKEGGTYGIECTPNHPFLAQTGETLDDTSWIPAEQLTQQEKHVCIMPFADSDNARPQFPDFNTGHDIDISDTNFLWLTGYWVAAYQNSKTEHDDSYIVLPILKGNPELAYSLSKHILALPFGSSFTQSDNNYISENAPIAAWLKHNFINEYGYYVPEWLMNLDQTARESFCHGFFAAAAIQDVPSGNLMSITTQTLALSMKRLMATLGYDVIQNKVIEMSEGLQPCEVRNTYIKKSSSYSRTEGVMNLPEAYTEVHTEKTGNIIVFNLEVDEDNSYTANGVAVHNCQTFSTARPRSMSVGLDDVEGGKGLLWWQLDRMIRMSHPRWCLFENVDRIIKSPAASKGRDFATILSCLADNGYDVEWHIVNAADYGNPQKRRRIFIFCTRHDSRTDGIVTANDLLKKGLMAKALPVKFDDESEQAEICFMIPKDPKKAFSSDWQLGKKSIFRSIGAMTSDGTVITCNAEPDYDGPYRTLGDILVDISEVPDSYFVSDADYVKWQEQRITSHVERTSKDGHKYLYSQGAMNCPDPLDKPGRTILTSGGHGPSRMKHIIATGLDIPDKHYRLLVPKELERLQCFPDDWTQGLSDTQRIFCMGNALVTDIPRRIGAALIRELQADKV